MFGQKISQPYNKRELLDFIRNHIFGPNKRYKGLAKFIPKSYLANEISPKLKIGFIGDIMSIAGYNYFLNKNLIKFFSDCDYLVGNFEGLFTEKSIPALFAQKHTEKTLQMLEKLLPANQIILCCANNHSADFGREIFKESYQNLKNRGYQVLGMKSEPALEIESGINLVNVTFLSNKPNNFLATEKQIISSNTSSEFANILIPHWGYELHLYPHPSQLRLAERLLKNWTLIAGHHSHTPQPISSFELAERKKICAFSLGNFCFGVKRRPFHQNGLVLKAEIGEDSEGAWNVGKIDWSFVQQQFSDRNDIYLSLTEKYRFFDL